MVEQFDTCEICNERYDSNNACTHVANNEQFILDKTFWSKLDEKLQELFKQVNQDN